MLGVIQRYADEDKAAAEKKAKEVNEYLHCYFLPYRLKCCTRLQEIKSLEFLHLLSSKRMANTAS